MSEFSLIGKSPPRVDGVAKVTGQAIYAGDLALPGMLYGKILRSPHAHAKIKKIDSSKAEKLTGVRSVITGKDFPGITFGHMPYTRDQLPMAMDKVRHIGEAVAAVAATSEDIAEEALDLIDVEYELLPTILTVEEALKEGAPRIHEKAESNIGFKCNYHWGDVDKGFSESDYIREEKFRTQRATAGFLEPHAVLASTDLSGRITLQASKQSPYITWRHFCRGMGVPLSKVRIITPYIGGGFSGKHEPFDLDFAAAKLSEKTKRPVKIVLNMDETLAFYKMRQDKDIWLKLGLKKDGTLMALDCKLIAEGGAYLNQTAFQCWVFAEFLNGTYNLQNIRFEANRIYTNKPASGTIYGHGTTASRYCFESMLSIVAREMGIDQVDIRLKNLYKSGGITANGLHMDVITTTECLEKVAEDINWRKRRNKREPNRGWGFATVCVAPGARMGGHDSSSALVKVVEDGTISIVSGCTEIGQGTDTVMAQIAAEVLGLQLDDVRVGVEDTDDTVLEAGMFAGRGTPIGGSSMKKAAEDARNQLAEMAAEALKVKAEDLEFRNRGIYIKGKPEAAMSFQDVTRLAYYSKGVPVYGHGTFKLPDVSIHDLYGGGSGHSTEGWPAAAQAVQVEVDTETGQVKILYSVGAIDCGRPINLMMSEGQAFGSAVFTTGLTLYEENEIDDEGRPQTKSFLDYKMPTFAECFPHKNYYIINESPVGPFGAKMGGEVFPLLGAPAIASAIEDAVGVRIRDLPITPQKVLKALKERR
ncbi:xanthine dehydrogenase family protein molybdopterin-binding subunit [Chloroflexota bacterium]